MSLLGAMNAFNEWTVNPQWYEPRWWQRAITSPGGHYHPGGYRWPRGMVRRESEENDYFRPGGNP